MKLSQKLLGLTGLAVADYACCPYDDYGIVDGDCGLSEKTPFDLPESPNWVNNMCKAWESNVDATYDGNDNCGAENWGGCGFQRHFAWGNQVALDAEFTKITMDLETDPNVAFNENSNSLIEREFDTPVDHFTVGGVPFLGGICKLFIPVNPDKITQVTVSGVHVNGQAQFPARIHKADENFDGTAYCFSVVNVQEFRTNTNGIGNGNVAGSQVQLVDGNAYQGGSDIFFGATSLQRQLGRDIGDFGEAAHDFETGDRTETMVEDGANFDVVAHFHYSVCQTGIWGDVDMQLTGDVGNGGTIDYPTDPDNNFSHAHTDLKDKRHNKAPIVTGGPYTQDGSYLTKSASEQLRWPNFGAWAGYNSMVACANVGSTDTDYWLHQNAERVAVLSVGSADFRSEIAGTTNCALAWAEYQFNIRQIGTKVVVCGPGQLPDADFDRCTWNWNYNAGANEFGTSNNGDPEGFFDRTDNLDFSVWSRKRRADVSRDEANEANQPVNADAVLTNPEFTMEFRDHDNNDLTVGDNLISLEQLSHTDSSGNTETGIEIDGLTIKVNCVNAYTNDGNNNQRDNFPSCFVGDEIHIKATYKPLVGTNKNRAFVSPWLTTVASVANTFPAIANP